MTAETMEQCKYLFGHAWYPYDAEPMTGGWAAILICERCGTKRRDLIGRTGLLHGRSYDHPDGYRDAGLHDTRADTRAAYYATSTADELARRRRGRAAG